MNAPLFNRGSHTIGFAFFFFRLTIKLLFKDAKKEFFQKMFVLVPNQVQFRFLYTGWLHSTCFIILLQFLNSSEVLFFSWSAPEHIKRLQKVSPFAHTLPHKWAKRINKLLWKTEMLKDCYINPNFISTFFKKPKKSI